MYFYRLPKQQPPHYMNFHYLYSYYYFEESLSKHLVKPHTTEYRETEFLIARKGVSVFLREKENVK